MNLPQLKDTSLHPGSDPGQRLRYWARTRPHDPAFILSSGSETVDQLTFLELDRRARSIAVHLQNRGLRGRHALLCYPQGLEFVTALFGCMYAGVTAVPSIPPGSKRHLGRLESVCLDSQAAIVLTDYRIRSRVEKFGSTSLRQIDWEATDCLVDDLSDRWEESPLEDDWTAVLQYTSGSTDTPKGVMLSAQNIAHNCDLIYESFGIDDNTIGLSWLPNFHDMGLIGGILKPLWCGRPGVLMSPMILLQQPVRWLREITRFGVTISGGPNFAYALCCDIADDQCQGLELSSWKVAFNGAEPIRAETLDKFARKFEPYGFRSSSFFPCYGMAETTLIVSGGPQPAEPVVHRIDQQQLETRHVATTASPDSKSRSIVGCGTVLPGMNLQIVDPDNCQPLKDGEVGEIWVRGPSVAQGYWKNPVATRQRFHARIHGDDQADYLRTGDLGFIHDGQLFVTGREKDLIIIRGRNFYPQDIEAAIESLNGSIRLSGCAAFSADIAGDEQLVVAFEVPRQLAKENLDPVAAAIRRELAEMFEISANTILATKQGKLPKTSSGKIRRNACRRAFQEKSLPCLRVWDQAVPQTGEMESPRMDQVSRPETLDQEAIQQWLVSRVARQMNCALQEIDTHQPFSRFGIDSLALVKISGELEQWLGIEVSPTLLFSYPTISTLAEFLANPNRQSGPSTTSDSLLREPVAIIGLGCRFPGADNPDQYWELLRHGLDAVGDPPASRDHFTRWYDPNLEARGRICNLQGGYLNSVDEFDPAFFGISPREAESLDPQQRLLMEICWETLENTGLPPDRMVDSNMGIFVGISSSDYAQLQNRECGLADIEIHAGTGSLNSIAAGRIAYFLGTHGPCLSVDTACSSSLVAVHLAMESLNSGQCDSALAGGVNLILDPGTSIALSSMRALSISGRCRTFDGGADGYVRGEGCGMVMLKRLSKALEDGDRVLAVIRGSAVNHDGRSNGLTAPHGPSQESLIHQALQNAQVQPEDVSYIEAHGTGTELGDPIEINSLVSVFERSRAADNRLWIGSVKTNIGHLEAAAGIAGLIKGVLSLRHQQIPAHLHVDEPNPFVHWNQIPLSIPHETCQWQSASSRRIMGVSSFGFSGTNAHLIVEEFPELASSTAKRPEFRATPCLLPISAQDSDALMDLAGRYQEFLSNTSPDFNDVCNAAATTRNHFPKRIAIVASDRKDCQTQLDACLQQTWSTGLFCSDPGIQPRRQIAMLFTGQGSQYIGMAHDLYEAHPVFRETLDECDRLYADQTGQSLLQQIYPSSREDSRLDQTEFTQPAIFSVSYSLWRLWDSWGVKPAAVFGHSIGEYTAACAAGVLGLADAMKLITARGRLIQQLPPGGEMFACAADGQTVQSVIEAANENVSIAAFNSHEQTVISGPAAAVCQVVDRLNDRQVATRQLNVSHAFHSRLMQPMLEEFSEWFADVSLHPPSIPLICNVTGRQSTEELLSRQYWVDQIRQPVRMVQAIEELVALGCNTFLEIGPQPILTTLGKQSQTDPDQLWLPGLRNGTNDWAQMVETVAQLYVNGVDLDWQAFSCTGRRPQTVGLPNYPFRRQRYWFQSPGTTDSSDDLQSVKDKDDGLSNARFEVVWRPKSRQDQVLNQRSADFLPDIPSLDDRLRPEINRLRSLFGSDRGKQFENRLEQLGLCHAIEALRQLTGGDPVESLSPSDANRLGVIPQHRQLFCRLLEMVARPPGGPMESGPAERDAESIASLAATAFPEGRGELELLRQCGENLADILIGKTDALQVLFPSGRSDLVEALYRESPFARSLNTVIEEAVVESVSRLPAGRPIRILEIGAGTGSTTAQILPRLPVARSEYLFTDVSEIFLREARQRFESYPFVQFGIVDLEQAIDEQDLAAGQFDIVIAANVLHATVDLSQSLTNVNQLMAPGGLLLMLEGTRKMKWLDLIFGLTEGWWRFTDHDLRPDHPLLSANQWSDIILKTGFNQVSSYPGRVADSDSGEPPQSVLVARKDVENRSTCHAQCRPDQATPATEKSSTEQKPPFVILADRMGVGQQLADRLREGGYPCHLVFCPDNAVWKNHGVGNYGNPDSPSAVFEQLQETPLAGVIYLWPLNADPVEHLTHDRLESSQQPGCHGALAAIQDLRTARIDCPVWLVTRGAQRVNDDPCVPGLSQSPLWGLGRVLAEEIPSLWGGLIDLDPGDSVRQMVEILETEITDPSGEDQIAFRGDQRYVARLVPGTDTAPSGPVPWRVDASYLITGGLGEIGLRTARSIAEQGAKSIILVGRKPLPESSQWEQLISEDDESANTIRQILQIEEQGARVHVRAADVADADQLDELLDRHDELGLPPIRGVFHAAGVVLAEGLDQLDHNQLDQVMRAKVTGTWLLHERLADARLDFFVCFSSGAAVLGSPMLGAYAAANAFMDAMVQHLAATGRPALSINWGFWSDIGMVSRSQREQGRGFAPQGMQSFTPEQGLHAMQQMMQTGTTQSTFMPVDWIQWARAHPQSGQAPLFRELVPASLWQDGPDVSAYSRKNLLDQPAHLRREMIEDLLRTQLATVSRLSVDEIDPDQPLNNLGIDSLMAVEMKNHVEKVLGVSIPVAQLLENPSIAQLTRFVDEGLNDADQVNPQMPGTMPPHGDDATSPNPHATSLNNAIEQVAGMSDEDVDRMLDELLTQQKDNT